MKDDVVYLFRAGWPLFFAAAAGLVLISVSLWIAVRQAQARKRRERLRVSLTPTLLSGAACLALPLLCFAMVHGFWEDQIAFAQGTHPVQTLDPGAGAEILRAGFPPRLVILEILWLGSRLLMPQALMAAVVIGFVLAGRLGVRLLAGVGLTVFVALTTVVPLAEGVSRFSAGWLNTFSGLGGADPSMRRALLVWGSTEAQWYLDTAVKISTVGLVVSCAVICFCLVRWLPSGQRRPRRVSLVATVLFLIMAAALWIIAIPYRLTPPHDEGPFAHYLRAKKLPLAVLGLLKQGADHRLLSVLSEPFEGIEKDVRLPHSTAARRCRQAIQVYITSKGILVEGDRADDGRLVDSEQLEGTLLKHAARLKKIQRMTNGKMPFRGELRLFVEPDRPYGVVANVLGIADRVGFGEPIISVSKDIRFPPDFPPDFRRQVVRCIWTRTTGPRGPRVDESEVDPELAARARRERLANQVEKMGVLKLLGSKGAGKETSRPVGTGDPGTDADKVFAGGGGLMISDHGPRASSSPVPQVPGECVLSVLITPQGFSVAKQGGADNKSDTLPCALPLLNDRCPVKLSARGAPEVDGHDYGALSRRALALKETHPRAGCIKLSAKPTIPFQVVVSALDALRDTICPPERASPPGCDLLIY